MVVVRELVSRVARRAFYTGSEFSVPVVGQKDYFHFSYTIIIAGLFRLVNLFKLVADVFFKLLRSIFWLFFCVI